MLIFRHFQNSQFLAAAAFVGLLTAATALASEPTNRDVHGKVVAEDSGNAVSGAVVTIVELNRRMKTKEDGSFSFARVPAGNFVLGVHAFDYASVHRELRTPLDGPLTISVSPDQYFQEEITVTARPWVANPLETAQSVDQVDQQRIKRAGNASVGEALERIPGLANIGTGDGLGTPVIRGSSENRVRVMNDGALVNHQQWSFRHPPNIEPLLAERIEVVRGPASVMWGPDALGGVINIVQTPLPSGPAGVGVFYGDVGFSYFDNDSRKQADAVLEGAVGGFGWRIGAVKRDADDYATPNGTLPGTDFEQTNSAVALGQTGSWGSARVRWDHWENDVGFYFPEGHPNVGFRLDLKDDTYAADVFLPTSLGDVNLLVSRQENSRRAFPPAAPVFPAPAVDLELVTTTLRAGFNHERFGAWKGSVAAEFRDVENDLIGPVPLIPNYQDRGYSLMILEEGRFLPAANDSFDRLILSFGARWDASNLEVPVGEANVPNGFDGDYDSLTGSLGLVYRATKQLSFAANLGRGWRAPNAFELFARGDHVGVGAFQLGNPELKEETAFITELSARWRYSNWRATVTGYRTDYSDYIYLVELTEDEIASIDPTVPVRPVFYYRQTDAVIDGFEVSAEVVPLERLELGLLYSSVNTENKSTDSRLPQTPPDRLSLRVRASQSKFGPLNEPFVELESVWVEEGESSGDDEVFNGRPFGAATGSYNLLHFKTGFELSLAGNVVSIDLYARNLLDEEYTDFLYPYKGLPYQGEPVLNPGRDVRLLARYRF